MSANPNRVRLGLLTQRQRAQAPLPQPLPPGARQPILPAGVARENTRRLQDLEGRVDNLEAVPTVPGALTQTVSQLSGTVASIRQAVESNGRSIATLNTQLNNTQRDLNTFRTQVDQRIDSRVTTQLSPITEPGGVIDQQIQGKLVNFTQPGGALDAQIDQKLAGFRQSPQFGLDIRNELSAEVASISSLNTSLTNVQGKIQSRDQPAFQTSANNVRNRFSGASTDIGNETGPVQGFISDVNAKRTSIGDRRSRLQRAINGEFGATGSFGLPDAKEAITVIRAALQDVSDAIGSLRDIGSRLNNSMGKVKDTFSGSGPDFASMGSKV